MSSQDTLSYAEDEEQRAKDIQAQIDRIQSDISSLQNDINSKTEVATSLQSKYQQHMDDATRLREQAINEQKQEQEDQLREQRENQDSLAKKTVKEAGKWTLFG